MIKSMTGFGRGTITGSSRSITVEVRAVNHRYLDLNIKLPRALLSLEEKCRNEIQKYLSRGKVDIYITQNVFNKEDAVAHFNESLGDSYYSCLNAIKNRYGLKDDISVSSISKMPDVITLEQKEEDILEIWNLLKEALVEALMALSSMRTREGEKLFEDIQNRCNILTETVNIIAERAPVVVSDYETKLKDRVTELLNASELDESRIITEVAIFADKCNIDEEIVRLKSHIKQMKDTLLLEEPIGRKLDFLVQEMNREGNTIASKANDLELINLVLTLKNEIEKIREQIQNIE